MDKADMMKPKKTTPPTSTAKKSPAPTRKAGHSASARQSPGQPYLPGKAKTPRKPDGKFEKGIRPNPGRAKGVRNRTTKLLKEAILEAATLIGQDGRGKNGLVGYLMMLAVKERAVYSRLLEKVLPMQIAVEDKTAKVYSAAEAAQRLKERGLPVPPGLLALVGPQESVTAVAHSLDGARETNDLRNALADPARSTTFDDEEFDIDADADEDERSSRDQDEE